MKTNAFDWILKNIILRVLTKDEWHTAVVGFADGLSFEIEGRWMRKALAKSRIDVANIQIEKVWYYRVPYVIGEICKLFLAGYISQQTGINPLA